MANSKGSSNIRNLMFAGKHALLPPKSPFPIVSPSYADYASNNTIGSKPVQKPRDGNTQHQRTSSESHLIEEQPSWLDDLLNEPETPVRRGGHRRSSSDSFAYIDGINVSNIDYQDDFKHKKMVSGPSWTSQGIDHHHTDLLHTSFYREANLGRQKNRPWESYLTAMTNPSTLSSARSNIALHNSGSLSTPQEGDGVPCAASEKQQDQEPAPHDSVVSERVDGSLAKPSPSDPDNKRAKQQFAQRSRVRKLQYIAELERNVQALQVEGSDFSAELEFLNQQNLILSMENKALKQRVESLAQEQLIKQLEQEVLEREIGRLRALYQQQQQPQPLPSSSSHRRNKSRDLDTQFANLSLKHKDATSSGRESVTGPLHI